MRRPLIALSSVLTLVLLLSGCANVANLNPWAGGANSARVEAPPPPPPPPPVAAPQPAPTAAPVAVGGKPVAALLLPLSGPSASVGTAMLNAAQLALFEVADDKFTLLPIDTKGTPEGAAAAAAQAVAQNVGIILGPLFAGEVRAVSPVAQAAGINTVAFSTDRSVANGAGAAGNTYVMGFLPQPQVMRILSYAKAQGLQRVGLLAPSSDYGRLVVSDASRIAGSAGVAIVATEYYDPQGDAGRAIGRLANASGLQAVLLADENGQRLRGTASQLGAMGVDPQAVKLLGTMLWEEARPGSEPGLVGGWYPAPPQTEHANFEQRYQRAYGAKPPRIASLAYDAAALGAVLARRGDYSASALTQPTGFAGVDGIFRLLADGTVERGFAILEVTPQGPRELAPAQRSFQPGT